MEFIRFLFLVSLLTLALGQLSAIDQKKTQVINLVAGMQH